MSELTIRRATADDLDEINRIEHSSFDADAFPRRVLRYLSSRARGGCFVAERQGRAEGYISLLTKKGWNGVRIYSVAVDTQARGKGVGAALVGFAAEFAKSAGMEKVSLEVRTDNQAAIGLYKKYGFSITGRLKAYYHDGADGYKMTLLLPHGTPYSSKE